MGFLDFIFGKRVKIQNEFFGEMLFVGDKHDPIKSYFECRRHFKPSDALIEIGIDGDISGPTREQVDFFRGIEENYAHITRSITPVIEDEFSNWKEGFRISDFQKEFTPVYLRLPRCNSKLVVWEIAFESDHDLNHTFSITMNNFEATEILIDG